MGIDIGRLERIIQVGAPVSVSSLVQRLGRSGRRGNCPEMWFVDWETFGAANSSLPYKIPWRMIQIIAMLQLYLEERWIEPPRIIKYPCSILYHQTMSIVAAAGELTFEALSARVLNLSSFLNISLNDFKGLIDYLIEKDHLQQTENGGLIIGLEGAKITENFNFYAVFPEEEEWAVMNGSEKIGCIEDPVPPGEYITVGGFCWQVSTVDNDRRIIFVNPTKRFIRFFWHGDRSLLHNRILQRMRQVLFEQINYPYLHQMASDELAKARLLARSANLDKQNLYIYHDDSLGCDICCIFPWMGHIAYHTFLRIIKNHFHYDPTVDRIAGQSPYFITVRLKNKTREAFLKEIKDIFDNIIKPEDIFSDSDIRIFKKECEYKVPKYDIYVPDSILRKQLIYDYVDLKFLKNEISGWQ
jgi:ATP-dependent Lhr-like helicase